MRKQSIRPQKDLDQVVNSRQKYFKTQKQVIDQELYQILTAMTPEELQVKLFDTALKHALRSGGKRLRPIMALASYQLFTDKAVSPDMLSAASALELIHTGSLLLDDLPSMDNALLRRGRTTSHRLFGESKTILVSAGMWVEAFRILAIIDHTHNTRLTEFASSAIGTHGLIHGQLLDLAAFNNVQTKTDLEACYILKTGRMFWLAVSIGAEMASASEDDINLVRTFANDFGVAYQILDDVIDVADDSSQSGKDADKDAQNSKPNYVSLLGVAGAKAELKRKLKQAESTLHTLNRGDATNLHMFVEQLRTKL